MIDSIKLQLMTLFYPKRLKLSKFSTPSMDLVEKFASLVSNSSKYPIYLHSKEGVLRTSSMISQWRQYMTRSASLTAIAGPKDSKEMREQQATSAVEEILNLEKENSSLQREFDKSPPDNRVQEVVFQLKNKNGNINGAYNAHMPIQNTSSEPIDDGTGSVSNICAEIDPMKVQIPPCNVFSKSEISRFFRTKKIAPPLYSKYKKRVSYSFESQLPSMVCSAEFAGSKPVYVFAYLNQSLIIRNLPSSSQGSLSQDGVSLSGNSPVYTASDMKSLAQQKGLSIPKTVIPTSGNISSSSRLTSKPLTDGKNFGADSVSFNDDELRSIEGDMCASTTRVVRVQSRRKAEMFLVRTDGFSCIRKKVTKPSLDFTHPSTQQQMLMWKSLPKTDLLLKKLGQELMKEAQEIHQRLVITWDKALKQLIHGNNTLDSVYKTLRMRLRCEIFQNGKAVPGKVFDVLNEVVVDRGSNPYLSKIEYYKHDRLITKVQGDEVIVATPTGSTIYSTAVGGSMVHPNVPCILFTPICPYSLSFRPVILPDSAHLEMKIPDDARSNAWASFDGKRRQQLSRGDSVRISMSQHPLPTVNKYDHTHDWF